MSGAADTDLTNVSANELMMWGLSNLWKEGREGAYAVQHGCQPISDFGRRRSGADGNDGNLFERAFPTLFPYGTGGIEAEQPVELTFSDHMKWALRYHDRRFRVHESFAFMAFGIMQRRQALFSAHLQMRRKTFESDAWLLSSITLESLAKAQEDESQGRQICDPAIQLLHRHIYATGGHVMGSDHARYQLRSQIWGTTMILNPPSIWITINPCDLHDPLAQVFAGEDVCMDDLLRAVAPFQGEKGPKHSKRSLCGRKVFPLYHPHYPTNTFWSGGNRLSGEIESRGLRPCGWLLWYCGVPGTRKLTFAHAPVAETCPTQPCHRGDVEDRRFQR